MAILLAGDIGGTKTILRLAEMADFDLKNQAATAAQLKTLHEATFPSQDFPDLTPIVRQFLSQCPEVPEIAAACFGIAGPVVDNTCELTNISWSLQGSRLEQELNIPKVNLINDFAAIGYSVLGLGPDDLHTLQDCDPHLEAPIAVLGAGTGLGEGFLIPQNGRYQVFASEGGHADFAPRNELEFQLLNYLRQRHQIQRVSIERVVSGQGIISIYEFLRDRQTAPESAHLVEVFQTWRHELGQDEKTIDPAAEISKAALAGEDYLCEKTMELFVSAYGAEAGNLALKLLPYGGLYVAGGIAAKILPLLKTGLFLRSFLNKGRITPLLEQIPVHIVLNPQVGLLGSLLYAAQHASKS